MVMRKKVSIIVPVHNASDYLKHCVNSVLRQTYSDLEVILINNASKDNSLQLCRQLSKQDARIVVIHTDEPGVSNARNLGLDAMTGDFVTFVDSDDWLEHNCIERALSKLEEEGADVSIWSFFKSFPQKELRLSILPNKKSSFTTDEQKEYLYRKAIDAHYDKISSANDVSVGTTWGKLYKAELIQENKIRFVKSLTRAQDVVFSLHAFKYAKKIYFFDENLYHYRIHVDSTCQSSRYIGNTQVPFNSLAEEVLSFVDGLGSKSSLLAVAYCRIVRIIYWHLDHNYFHVENKKSFSIRRKEVLSLISKSYYKEALDNVELSKLPKQRKIMVFLLRRRMVYAFYIFEQLLSLRNRFLLLIR